MQLEPLVVCRSYKVLYTTTTTDNLEVFYKLFSSTTRHIQNIITEETFTRKPYRKFVKKKLIKIGTTAVWWRTWRETNINNINTISLIWAKSVFSNRITKTLLEIVGGIFKTKQKRHEKKNRTDRLCFGTFLFQLYLLVVNLLINTRDYLIILIELSNIRRYVRQIKRF